MADADANRAVAAVIYDLIALEM